MLLIPETFKRPMVISSSGTESDGQFGPRYTLAQRLFREVHSSPYYRSQCHYNMKCLDHSSEEVIKETLVLTL